MFICSFGCLLFLVGIRVSLSSDDDDGNEFMTFYELHVFQSTALTNSLYSFISPSLVTGRWFTLAPTSFSHDPTSSLLPSSQHVSAPLVYFLPRLGSSCSPKEPCFFLMGLLTIFYDTKCRSLMSLSLGMRDVISSYTTTPQRLPHTTQLHSKGTSVGPPESLMAFQMSK